jgi:hypothetical protein
LVCPENPWCSDLCLIRIRLQERREQAGNGIAQFVGKSGGGSIQDCLAGELFIMLVPLSGMKKKLKWIVGVLVVVFALAQLANPSRTNPPVVSDLMAANVPPPHVAALLHAACYDCHSHETKWPWYAHIAPASWLVAHDVNEGRQHLNLSDWPVADSARAAKKLDRMSEEIDYREMPPAKYTLLHADARLTDADRNELTNWLDATAERLRPPTVK